VTHRFLLTAFLSTAAVAAAAQNTSAAKPAAQTPQPLSRTVYMQKVDNSFVVVDTNKDGFMDRTEIEAAETKILTAEKTVLLRRREAFFRSLDANKDGNLTLAEFNAKVAAVPIKANATPVLNRLDTNKDGKISLAENRVPSMAQFDRADTKQDGMLSPAYQTTRVKR
jgi:Ca2+-binding EF-hand superfamily protein